MYKYGIIETENRDRRAGKDVVLTWLFEENGTLSIFGAGMLPDYRDGQERPWQEYADQVTAVVIDDGITTIGARTFAGYDKLQSVKLPSSLSRIGFRAFADCTALTSVECPNPIIHVNTTQIGNAARGVLRENTAYMGMQSFANTPWVVSAYGDFYIHKDVLVEYYGAAANVTVPEGIRQIGKSAFEGSAVKTVKLPGSLKIIESFAFNKTGLTAVELPASVRKVERYAFAQTEALESVLVGSPSTVLESMAFWNSAAEAEIILNKADRSALAKLEKEAGAPIEVKATEIWKDAVKRDVIPGEEGWASVYHIESVREASMDPNKRLEIRRNEKFQIGAAYVEYGAAVMKKLSVGGPVIRFCLNEETKKVEYVQSFVKDTKDTYASYRFVPVYDEDTGVYVMNETYGSLTKAEMLKLNGEGLWPNTSGFAWYQAPKGTAYGVFAERQALKFWLARHKDYHI